jgi:thiamine biosynthesis lipoprotein
MPGYRFMVTNKHLLFLLLLLWLLMLSPGTTTAEWYRQDAAIMGTAIAVDLWDEDESRGRALTQAVIDEMHRIDDLMSTYKPGSELSRINARAAEAAMPVSPELLALIQRALDFSRLTDGAFDITYASAGQYYDYREGILPSSQQLAQALPAIDYHHVRIDPQAATIRFLYPGVRIDLGGIAKGYAVDRCIAILQDAGVKSAMVNAGGDTRVLGKHWKQPWMVGIRDPRNEEGLREGRGPFSSYPEPTHRYVNVRGAQRQHHRRRGDDYRRPLDQCLRDGDGTGSKACGFTVRY